MRFISKVPFCGNSYSTRRQHRQSAKPRIEVEYGFKEIQGPAVATLCKHRPALPLRVTLASLVYTQKRRNTKHGSARRGNARNKIRHEERHNRTASKRPASTIVVVDTALILRTSPSERPFAPFNVAPTPSRGKEDTTAPNVAAAFTLTDPEHCPKKKPAGDRCRC